MGIEAEPASAKIAITKWIFGRDRATSPFFVSMAENAH